MNQQEKRSKRVPKGSAVAIGWVQVRVRPDLAALAKERAGNDDSTVTAAVNRVLAEALGASLAGLAADSVDPIAP